MKTARLLHVLGALWLAAQPLQAAAEPAWFRPGAQALGQDFMVVAANPLASAAGYDILAEGGNAIDAMVAVQLVLNLVEPQSSGIGGGSFLLYYDAASNRLTTLDGRETAPRADGPDLFLDDAGAPLDFFAAVVGGRSVGTPGTLRLLAEAHRRYGALPWASLFQPAIDLAEQGFAVSPRLAGLLTGDTARRLQTYAPARDYFFPGGVALAAGQILKNPAFAATLRRIAAEGPDAFYRGAIAQDIVAAVHGAADNPGGLALGDLAGYEAVWRDPVCVDYRDYDVCGMGPPSSGGIAIAQMLRLLEPTDIAARGPDDPQAWHLFIEAAKLAYADRNAYVADSDFVDVPVAGLLDPAYLAARAALIDPGEAAAPPVAAGQPPATTGFDWAPGREIERPGTSHFSIIDRAGNAVSMTTSIEGAFGSQLMVDGFMLNNELTDFSFAPEEDGRPVANRVEAGKRPRSSMAPTIVLDATGRPYLLIGSPGGSRIPLFVAEAVIAALDWHMAAPAAVALPHVVNRNGDTEIEPGLAQLADPLTALGQTVTATPLDSGLHAIAVTPTGLLGGADPHREGLALGR